MTTRRGNRPRTFEHRKVVEAAILNATAAQLEERPFREVSVEGVMTAAGLSRTAFYRYFPDLEAVMLRLLEDTAARLSVAAGKWMASDDPRQLMEDVALEIAWIFRSDARLILAFADAAAGAPEVEAAWREAVGRLVGGVASKIVELQSGKLVVVEEPVEVARALVWMTERYLLEVFGRQPDAVTPETAAKVLDRIWRRALFSP
jgi:AcrR family transcriptional regulator